MSATLQAPSTTLTGEAYDLIWRFYDGVDDLVYQVAEQVARKRTGIKSPSPVRIEVADVKAAGCQVVAAIRRLGDTAIEIPDELQAVMEGTEDCNG